MRPIAPVVLAAAAAAGIAGCFEPLDPDEIQTSTTSHCLTCHLHDYQRIVEPVHEGQFPRTCDSCHRTDGWQPALEGLHPEVSRFPIDGGAHGGIACLDCHDPLRGPSIDGENTICTTCHTHRRSAMDSLHDGVDDYLWRDDDPGFCLGCHYVGAR